MVNLTAPAAPNYESLMKDSNEPLGLSDGLTSLGDAISFLGETIGVLEAKLDRLVYSSPQTSSMTSPTEALPTGSSFTIELASQVERIRDLTNHVQRLTSSLTT